MYRDVPLQRSQISDGNGGRCLRTLDGTKSLNPAVLCRARGVEQAAAPRLGACSSAAEWKRKTGPTSTQTAFFWGARGNLFRARGLALPVAVFSLVARMVARNKRRPIKSPTLSPAESRPSQLAKRRTTPRSQPPTNHPRQKQLC